MRDPDRIALLEGQIRGLLETVETLSRYVRTIKKVDRMQIIGLMVGAACVGVIVGIQIESMVNG